MYCRECGKDIPADSKFCLDCGTPTGASFGGTEQIPGKEWKKSKGRILTSPVAIILMVTLGLVVVTGITFGIILLVQGGNNNTIDKRIMESWDGFQKIADYDKENFGTIDLSPATVAKTQADLQEIESQTKELEKDLAAFDPTNEISHVKYAQMAAVLGYYSQYTKKTDELYKTIIAGPMTEPQVIARINDLLKEMYGLANKVKASAVRFLDSEGV
jgi:hypothetical protein